MTESSWPPSGDLPPPITRVNTEQAHNARVWNYWLGGKDNYLVDRQVGDRVCGMFPVIVDVARADRQFLGRAVRYLAGQEGIRQFLDIGTGMPTMENTHEVAQRSAPESRIVYVDNDPLVLTHAVAMLTSTRSGATDFLDADVHNPDSILAGAARTLDFTRPVAIMMLGILNFVEDTERAGEIVRRLLEGVPAGSHLVITHPTLELGGEANAEAMEFWNENAAPRIRTRTGAEVGRFFEGLEFLEPGLVSCGEWRPDPGDEPVRVPQYGAIARKS